MSIEGIGGTAELSVLNGREKTAAEPIFAENYEQAAAKFLEWSENRARHGQLPDSFSLDAIAVRVVHGGREFQKATPIDTYVIEKILQFEKLAPLHNKSSVEVLDPLRRRFPKTPIFAIFDTAFHRTIPEHVATYAIPLALARRHQIRRYGFHGISHRYLLERYAHLVGRDPEDCNIVSIRARFLWQARHSSSSRQHSSETERSVQATENPSPYLRRG